MDDMKTKTVSELAELFGVTRQAMNKRVKSLDTKFVEKNEKNVTVVNAEGIHELEGLYGKVVTAKAEVLEEILKEYPQIEIVQIQFNYVDYEDPAVESRKCYEVCPQHLQIRELLQDVAKEFEK